MIHTLYALGHKVFFVGIGALVVLAGLGVALMALGGVLAGIASVVNRLPEPVERAPGWIEQNRLKLLLVGAMVTAVGFVALCAITAPNYAQTQANALKAPINVVAP